MIDRFTFKAIPRLLEMIEPTDRAKAYIAKLADILEVEGYSSDAKIVKESLKRMNGEEVAMATMDEEPLSEDWKEAYRLWCLSHKDGDILYCIDAWKAALDWQKEQFEKNRLKHCNSITNEQAELEQVFIDQHLDKYQRMPTFLDAIEYGMRLQKEQMIAKAKGGTVQEDYQIIMDDGTYIDLDPSMQLKPAFNVNENDKVKVIVIKED